MILFILVVILIIISFYNKYYTVLFCVSIFSTFYSSVLFNCFYDNKIIFDWITNQKHTEPETLMYNKDEISYNVIFNYFLIVLILLSIIFIAIQSYKDYRKLQEEEEEAMWLKRIISLAKI